VCVCAKTELTAAVVYTWRGRGSPSDVAVNVA